jgi:phage-related protein
MHNLEYNGTSLRKLGFCIANAPFYHISNRKFEIVDIYGKDGGIIADNGFYENIDVSYEINSLPWLVYNDTQSLIRMLAEEFANFDGKYKELRDTYNTGYYAKAICKSIDKIEYKADKCVSTILNFTRQPFWYSDEGQKTISFSAAANSQKETEFYVYNPEKFSAEPYFCIYHSQDLTLDVNNAQIKIKAAFVDNENLIELDSEMQSAFCGITDMNAYISCTSFPVFTSGWNKIKVISEKENAFSKINIIPRWRRL